MAVITISRQTGSLGEEIAAQLSQNLKHELIDDRKIHELAESCDDEYKTACSAYEMETFKGFFERITFNRPAYRSLFEALNFELAGRGNVILLGRGVQVVLKDFAAVIKVRIVAPDEVRIARVAASMQLSLTEARDYVRNQDLNRRALLQSIYDVDLDDFQLYDMVINTGGFEVAAAVEMIAAGVAHKARSQALDLPAEALQSMATAKRLESIIRKRVETLPFIDGIQVSLQPGGEARLSGFVYSERDRDIAQQEAAAYPGVCAVRNQLRVVSGL